MKRYDVLMLASAIYISPHLPLWLGSALAAFMFVTALLDGGKA